MPRNYGKERDLIIRRWYGRDPTGRNPRPMRFWSEGPIRPEDGLGIDNPVNSPLPLVGHCIAWRYTLDSDGYGTQKIDDRTEKVHRAVFQQTRGSIPVGKQINHLCDRPYCFQPSHLYAGTQLDNADDSALFRDGGHLSKWELANYFDQDLKDDPFLQRLRKTQRCDGTPPWAPVEQPPQGAWESFVCEDHDFAIPMRSDTGDRICRVCEESELSTRLNRDREVPSLIADLWPASQSIPEMFEAIWESRFTGNPIAEQRRSAYNRSTLRVFGGNHRLRTCDCYLCGVDRRTFREAIDENLTSVMITTLDFCDDLRSDIENVVSDARGRAMQHLSVAARLDDDQAGQLVLHAEKCKVDEADTSAVLIERMLGGAAYSVLNGEGDDEALGQEWAKGVRWLFGFLRRFPDEDGEFLESASTIARGLAHDLLARWADLLTDTVEVKGSPQEINMDPLIASVAGIGAAIQLFELFRFEARGKSSGSEVWPHPHENCIAQIRDTGRWESESMPSAFEDGRGYRSENDPLKRFPRYADRVESAR